MRVVAVLVVLVCGGIFAVAATMSPSPSGYGTHEQLGMPPCSFLVKTGYPCPTCGLTTSLSAAASGHIIRAMEAHPFGPMLLAAAAILALAGAAQAFSGRNIIRRLRPGWLWAAMLAGGLLAGWIWNLSYGLITGTLPIH